MKPVIRPLSSWQMLVRRLVGAVPEQENWFVVRMYENICRQGQLPSEAEAIRLDELADKYRAAQ